MRLVKCMLIDDTIQLFVLSTTDLSDAENEMVSEAASEILADVPAGNLSIHAQKHIGPLPMEDLIQNGWIYQRFESV